MAVDTPRDEKPRVTIVGAGFSGLVTAYYYERAGFSVEILERASRPGGLITTVPTPQGIVETGANAFLNSVRVEALFRDLEVPQIGPRRASRSRLIFRDGRPRRWPLGLGAVLRILLFLPRFLLARSSLRPIAGESVAAWGRRFLGAEITEFLLLPALQGIYAGDGERLSANLVLSALFRPRGPAPRLRGSVSAPEGMGSVIAALRSKLESRGVVFRFGIDTVVDPKAPGLIIFCGSALDAANALERSDPELSRELGRIEMLPVSTTTAFYPEHAKIREGFGCLFPKREGFHSLGVLYNSTIFGGRGKFRSETWIGGGAKALTSAEGMTESGILRQIEADRRRLHRVDEKPISQLTHIWPTALPHYTIELEKQLPVIERMLADPSRRGLRLVGNYLGGLGLTKIVDRAAETAEREKKIRAKT